MSMSRKDTLDVSMAKAFVRNVLRLSLLILLLEDR
jgi:hypothetical protein